MTEEKPLPVKSVETPKPAQINILIVDDENEFLELYRDILSVEGYNINTARNGREALSLLQSHVYHLVLLDISMPVMDGIELLREGKPKYPGTDFILMTAYGGFQSAVEALRFGAFDYITKPFAPQGVLSAVRRCLEKQRLAHELKNTQEALINKEKLAALGAMAGWLAHRMRNPLNVILMCSQYLKTRFPESDERFEVALAIEDKGRSIEQMIRDFIHFSRSYEPNFRMENIHLILEDAVGKLSSRFRIQNVRVEKNFASDLPLVPLDKDLLGEVFSNIFDNALWAIDGPGHIKIRTALADEKVQVDISNSGAPIDPKIAQKVFDPFFTTKDRGTGLGMAIAHRVVESHHGAILISSGEETTVHIQLPVKNRADQGEK